MSTTTYKQWDIVLVPFPFTNLKQTKKRPGLVVSPDQYNSEGSDVIIAFMTSKLDGLSRKGDYSILNWELSNLPKPTLVRMKFATILSSIIIIKLGHLHSSDISSFSKQLRAFF